jgi:hypothetical protein
MAFFSIFGWHRAMAYLNGWRKLNGGNIMAAAESWRLAKLRKRRKQSSWRNVSNMSI